MTPLVLFQRWLRQPAFSAQVTVVLLLALIAAGGARSRMR